MFAVMCTCGQMRLSDSASWCEICYQGMKLRDETAVRLREKVYAIVFWLNAYFVINNILGYDTFSSGGLRK